MASNDFFPYNIDRKLRGIVQVNLDTNEAKTRMNQALDHFHDELKKIRAGRANPAMLDSIMVNAYGQPIPLKHVANVIVVDNQLLQITPFDPHNLSAISNSISESSMGLNPSDDGHVVRVPIPSLTEERRKELIKMLGEKTEEAKVAFRNIRHDFLKEVKSFQQSGELSEDEYHRTEKVINEMVDDFNLKVDEATAHKEIEIMTV